jgi:hypothetical protein
MRAEGLFLVISFPNFLFLNMNKVLRSHLVFDGGMAWLGALSEMMNEDIDDEIVDESESFEWYLQKSMH